MAKCPICGKRTANRNCPALGKAICSICCGEQRLKTIACPRDCPYLVAAEEKLREKRAKELSREWERLFAFLREKGRDRLIPLLDILREGIANGLYDMDATDAEVVAALEYCASKLSPIELLERAPNLLGRALEEALLPLVQAGKLDRELTREALRALAEFVEDFSSEKDERRFVRGLLGLYPPPRESKSRIIRPEGTGIVRPG